MNHAAHAQHYAANLGMHVIPLKPSSKLPIEMDWGNNCLVGPESSRLHFEQHPEHNIGLALGPSGFCSLDIDCDESFAIVMTEMGIDPSTIEAFPTIQGSPKGRRLLFRVPDGMELPYAKLNWPRQSDQKKQFTVFELRAAHGDKQRFDVLPPSIHPDTQQPYRWIVEGPASREDWPTPPDWLMVLWQQWDRFKPQLKSICPWVEEAPAPVASKPKVQGDYKGASVIDEYQHRNSLADALSQYGYKRIGKRWLSPSSGTGLPGVVPFSGGESCWIHNASDPLCSEETGKPVNAFDLYVEYEHGGDVSKACKALAKEYGFKAEKREQARHPDAVPEMPPEQVHDAAPEEVDDMPPAMEFTEEDAPDMEDEKGDAPAPAKEEAAPSKPGSPFKALGFDGDHFFYLPRGTEQVVSLRRGSHTSPAELMALASYEWWAMAYPKGNDGVDWQLGASDCMRMCERRGVYSIKNVRGRGAWYDSGSSILHLGDHLLVDGERQKIADYDSRYIYTRQAPMESTISDVQATDDDAKQVFDIVCGMNWSKPVHGWLTAGWVVLAPICGALKWRPHLWLTAKRGGGKSWGQDHIITPLLGPSGMIVQGGTTEAGIRQNIKQDARPVLFDEAEAEHQRGQARMQGVLELARQSSSESSAEIIKGTAAGGGMAFRMRSMFMLGSVNVSLTQAADESRFSVVSLETPNKAPEEAERFKTFERHVDGTLSPDFCASIRARTYRLIPTIRKNSAIMAQAIAEELGSQRTGDQVGTLLAGAFSLSSSEVITLDEARQWVKSIDLTDAEEQEQASDEENCMARILQTQVRLEARAGIYTRSIAELIIGAKGRGGVGAAEPDECAQGIERYGLKIDGDDLLVSNTHSELAKILRDSAWGAGWKRVIGRLPGAMPAGSPVRFAGAQSRCIRIPLVGNVL